MGFAVSLAAARQRVRDTLATITPGNGYAVTIKSTNGGQNENPLKTPDSLLSRAFVYSTESTRKPGRTDHPGHLVPDG
jgi:hypothetical protein